MNNFKNGTLVVAVATILIAIFILMSDRKAPETIKKAHEEVTVSKESELIEVETETENVASNTDGAEPQANAESQANDTLQSEITSSEVTSSEVTGIDKKAAPDGPYTNKDTTTEQIVEAEPSSDATKQASLPIWMDQKLGNFKSIEKGEVVFKIMPVNADGLQGKNPQGVITNKSDTYSSNMVSADYNYQQMPMYNGGYYIAPMPSYLMPSILPVKNGN